MTYATYDGPPGRRPRKASPPKKNSSPPARPKRELSAPVTMVLEREPHPNAFMQVPKGTKVTVQWPKL